MTNYEMLINTLINETLATAESDQSKTWDDFYQTLSEDSKSGYSALMDEVCSYEDTENGEKYIDKDDVFEAIVTDDKTDVDSLIQYLINKVLENEQFEADCIQQAKYDYECEQADLAYATARDQGLGLC